MAVITRFAATDMFVKLALRISLLVAPSARYDGAALSIPK